LREGPFKNLWIQPAAGDAGGAVGAAYSVWHQLEERPRNSHTGDRMRGSFLGPAFRNEDIAQFLNSVGAPYEALDDDALFSRVAEELASEKVVGWLQGPMEFGSRALGGRSILGDPRSRKIQAILNLKIKHRESFRPFAPSVLRERVSDYFEMDVDSPYMLLSGTVHAKRRLEMDAKDLTGIDLFNVPRSDIPVVTHVDYSARVQTVHEETNPRYYRLLKEFERKTGCATLVNTSFNVPGDPIVCSPEDAFHCFIKTEMDVLVLENCILYKEKQSQFQRTRFGNAS
jgi:carbamoyltransferase